MPKAIITVEVRGSLIIATTMGGRELVRTTEDLKGNKLEGRIHCALGDDTKFQMVSPCARKISGGVKKIRAQFKALRWHPRVHRVDPRQRLIRLTSIPLHADPLWKNPVSPFNRVFEWHHHDYIYVGERGRLQGGPLRGQMQKIPFDLGEAVEKAARDADARNGWTPQNQRRLAAAAQRVREWRP